MKKQFTILELLVIVAIIGILASLLLPSLKQARDKSRLAVCKNNLKQISYCFAMYHSDYQNIYPPFMSGSTNKISWDDLLSDYDGRNLSDEDKNKTNLNNSLSFAMYECPDDDFPRRDTNPAIISYGISLHRSYYNTKEQKEVNLKGHKYYGVTDRNLSELSKPSETIATAEYVSRDKQYLGNSALNDATSWAERMQSQFNDTNGSALFHKKLDGSNYLMADSSVQYLSFLSTIQGGSTSNVRQTMWDSEK